MSGVLEAGFADPVFGAQGAFRAIMEALARPGSVTALAGPEAPPAPLTPELAAVALTLLDHDTKVWLDPPLAESEAVSHWLAFHTGAPLTTDPADAAFALATEAAHLPPLDRFAQGTDEYPDRSTTIVLAVPALAGSERLALRGPGIRDRASIEPAGLPEDFAAQWRANRGRFPRGIDLLLVADGMLAGLPRTTRLES